MADSWPTSDALVWAGRGIGLEDGDPSGALIEVKAGAIAGIERSRAPAASRAYLFNDGFVIPPLVDIHSHVGPGISKYGVDRPDRPLGMLSQGDAGPGNIDTFAQLAIPGVCYAISIASNGEASQGPCYDQPNALDPDGAAAAFARHGGLMWGVSINLDRAARGNVSAELIFDESMEVARDLDVPVVLGTGEVASTDVVRHIEGLRSGDVLTYLFRGGVSDLFSHDETIGAIRRAAARGVVLDASHGSYSFDPDVGRRALEAGVRPTTLSSDISAMCSDPTRARLGLVVGKAVALGIHPGAALAAVTRQPGLALGLSCEELGEGSSAHFEVARLSGRQVLDESGEVPLVGPVLDISARVRGGFVQIGSGW